MRNSQTCLGQLGDVNPIEYGGFWILKNGEEITCEILELPLLEITETLPGDTEGNQFRVYRFSSEKCFFENGIISDNPFHKNKKTWFADSLKSVASSCGMPVDDLIRILCSQNPVERSTGYQILVEYFGPDQFDDYPLSLSLSEVKKRYLGKNSKLKKCYSPSPSLPVLISGYAFQSSRHYPKEPATVIVGETEIAESAYNGTAMIDGVLCNRFKLKNCKRYFFQTQQSGN